MNRARHTLITLLATACFATAALAENPPQPPRRTPYPDASQRSVRETGYAFSTFGGFLALSAESELFVSNEFDFGITDDDFLAGIFGFEFDFRVLPRVYVSVGFDTGDADTLGSYLDLVYEDGGEIEHSARLAMTGLSLGVRLHLLDGAARVRPYLIGGVTGAYYRYSEIGEFVDFETADIYYDEFEETSFLPGFFAGAGADVAVIRLPAGGRVELFGEFRYARVEGEHTDGFDGFGDLRFDRPGGLFGFRVRW